MTLCPGLHPDRVPRAHGRRRDAVPRPLWLDVDRVVDEALADWDAGKQLSIPSKRYKVITAVSRHVPTGVLHRFQSLGRR